MGQALRWGTVVDDDPKELAAGEASQTLDARLIIALERVGHALRTGLRLRAKEAGVTLTQGEILLRLASGRLGRRRVGALAEEFDVRQPTVSDAVSALERKGLIERRRAPGDARSIELTLTPAGRETVAELSVWDIPALEFLTGRLDGEKEVTLGLLVELIAQLNRVGAIQVARTCPTCRFFQPDGDGPPRCALLDMALGPGDFRVDCPDHEPLPDDNVGALAPS